MGGFSPKCARHIGEITRRLQLESQAERMDDPINGARVPAGLGMAARDAGPERVGARSQR